MSEEDVNKYESLKKEWVEFQKNCKVTENKEALDKCFKIYSESIINNNITLENYAHQEDKDSCTYLCTFIERRSREPYGYARVGNMYQYGISYVKDSKYYIDDKLLTDDEKKQGEKYKKDKKKEVLIYDIEFVRTIFKKKIRRYLNILLKCKIEGKIKTIGKLIEGSSNPMTSKQFSRKLIAMQNKGKFLFIYNDTINSIFDFFIENSEDKTDLTNIEKNFFVTQKLITLLLDDNKKDENYMICLSSFIWRKFNSTLNFDAKNTILHGAPGTGKTYLTNKSITNQLTILDNQDINKQYKLVQFHPSFGYEEFIDGIKPVKSTNNAIQLELVNGIFKEMCIDSFKELILASNENREAKNFYFVADEINRAELSRVFGELLLCLEEDKRLGFDKKGHLVGTKIKTQNSSLWQKEHAVVIMNKETVFKTMDEDGNYAINKDDEENYDYYFGVPENLYFIGTMNDIDRSVDSFDMALRRRFIWKHYSYKKEVVKEHYEEKFPDKKPEGLENFLEKCEHLNNYIISEDGFNLPEAYMLGQSYFMGLSSFSDTQLTKQWGEKIAPLLTEYLRVNFEGRSLVEKLECTKKIFLNKEPGKNCK